jgi:hypothetical protein
MSTMICKTKTSCPTGQAADWLTKAWYVAANRSPHPVAKHSSRLVTAPITLLSVHRDEQYRSSLMMHRKL